MKINPHVPVVMLFVLSLLCLIAAYVLSASGKSGFSFFLFASVIFAVFCAVIGSNGKVSLREVVSAIKVLRRP